MPINLTCSHCGRVIFAPSACAGKEIVCPGCGRAVDREGAASRPSSSEKPVQVACPQCEAPLQLVASLVGQRVFCNACHTGLHVSLTVTRAELPPPGTAADADPFGDIAAGDTASRVTCRCGKRLKAPASFAGQTIQCPNCRSTVRFPGPNGHKPSEPHEIQEPHFAADHSEATADVEAPAEEYPPLSPREVSVELRDRRIRTALHIIATGEQTHDPSPAPAPRQTVDRQPAAPPVRSMPPWFWPLTVATTATCIMVIMLRAIAFLP